MDRWQGVAEKVLVIINSQYQSLRERIFNDFFVRVLILHNEQKFKF